MEASKNYTQLPPQPGHADPYRVTLCEDGTYRWIYDFNMYKNPTILFTVYKVMFFSVAIVGILIFFFSLISGNLEWPPFKNFNWDNSKYGIIVMAFFIFVLPFVAYLIVAKIYGGRYLVLFEMNDQTITHHQMEKTFQKAQGLSWLTGFLGAATGNLSMTGLSIVNATRQSMASEYGKVRRIIPKKGRNLIMVNHRFQHNQIYVKQEDFDFVLQYLREKTGIR